MSLPSAEVLQEAFRFSYQANQNRTYQTFREYYEHRIISNKNETHLHCPLCKETIISPNMYSFSTSYSPSGSIDISDSRKEEEKNSEPKEDNSTLESHSSGVNLKQGDSSSGDSHSSQKHLLPFNKWWKVASVMSFDNIALSREAPEKLAHLFVKDYSAQEHNQEQSQTPSEDQVIQVLTSELLQDGDAITRLLTCGACEREILGFVSRRGESFIACEKLLYRVTNS